MNTGTNIFTALKRHDESEEEKRPNKKEVRAIDKSTLILSDLREGQGDYVNKDTHAIKQHKPHHGEEGETREGKREFDRKSGTV